MERGHHREEGSFAAGWATLAPSAPQILPEARRCSSPPPPTRTNKTRATKRSSRQTFPCPFLSCPASPLPVVGGGMRLCLQLFYTSPPPTLLPALKSTRWTKLWCSRFCWAGSGSLPSVPSPRRLPGPSFRLPPTAGGTRAFVVDSCRQSVIPPWVVSMANKCGLRGCKELRAQRARSEKPHIILLKRDPLG